MMKKAEATRQTILQKGFDLIYTKGYQTTSIEDILSTTQVTKGAFYYHFRNKEEMGLAIINELMKPTLQTSFVDLQKEENPLKGIYNLMKHLLLENDFLKVEYGCPASNFTQEMTPWNTHFSKALNEIIQTWIQVMTDALNSGIEKGFVSKETNTKQVTIFVISGYWGIRNLGRLEDNTTVYTTYLNGLNNYLHSLV
ncbi:TetR/AcrR family transcriptional regulator [Wenyingzhuangia sp. 2_MG-2023]|uniref:TetR/AcrR family transcriptional regulator n=1 Tax=Wenyingzhuangia sp. 2_MG-2023 TaxID=3062639 RepID=UPI003014E79F